MCDDNCSKLKNLYLERLKREDDEEQWISGEELCTEGSSDEEANPKKPKSKSKCKPKTQVKAKAPMKDAPDNTEITPENEATGEENCEKTDKPSSDKGLDAPIQWRPKRGSIKLPVQEGERVELS